MTMRSPTLAGIAAPESAAVSSMVVPPPVEPPLQATSASARIRIAEMRRMSDPRLVFAGPRVDADGVALIDEDRHLDDEPRLRRGGLARPRLGVAGETGL